ELKIEYIAKDEDEDVFVIFSETFKVPSDPKAAIIAFDQRTPKLMDSRIQSSFSAALHEKADFLVGKELAGDFIRSRVRTYEEYVSFCEKHKVRAKLRDIAQPMLLGLNTIKRMHLDYLHKNQLPQKNIPATGCGPSFDLFNH